MSKKAEKNKYNIIQPKYQCKNFDSDCLLVKDHLNCWLGDKLHGHCPFLQGKDYITFRKNK